MKKILFAITLLFISITNVNAEACDAYDIKRLKEIAEGVEITYEILPAIETEDEIIRDRYKINITGLTDEILAINKEKNKYYYNNTNFEEEGVIASGKYEFIIRSKICDRNLKTINLKLLVYNNFYNSDDCKLKDNKDLYICKEWVEERIDNEEFIEYLTSTKEENSIKIEKNNNYRTIIIVAVIIIVFVSLIYKIIKRKKEELK